MNITHGEQTINLFPKEIPKIAPISLSGGLDSASLLYLICRHFPQIEIYPYTCKDLNAPKDAEAAEQIVKWMQKEFPNNKLHDIQIYEFNDRTEDFVTWKEVDNARKQYPKFNDLSDFGVSKIIQVDRISWNFMSKFPGAVRIDGMTRNPPASEMQKLGFYEKAERRRDKEEPTVEEWRTDYDKKVLYIYQAYANVDKKFVAGVYQDYNLMHTLFPLTRSCTGTAKQTDNFTRECHKCFWCHEKKWAFNLEWELDQAV